MVTKVVLTTIHSDDECHEIPTYVDCTEFNEYEYAC